jgi:hypothetical protein
MRLNPVRGGLFIVAAAQDLLLSFSGAAGRGGKHIRAIRRAAERQRKYILV